MRFSLYYIFQSWRSAMALRLGFSLCFKAQLKEIELCFLPPVVICMETSIQNIELFFLTRNSMKIIIDFPNQRIMDFIICRKDTPGSDLLGLSNAIFCEVIAWVPASSHYSQTSMQVRRPDWYFMYYLSSFLRNKMLLASFSRWREYFVENSLPN